MIVVEDDDSALSPHQDVIPNSTDAANKIRVLAEDETVRTRALKDSDYQEVVISFHSMYVIFPQCTSIKGQSYTLFLMDNVDQPLRLNSDQSLNFL